MFNSTARKAWVNRPVSPFDTHRAALMTPIELGDQLNAGAFGGTAIVRRVVTPPYHHHAAKEFVPEVLASRRTGEMHDKLVLLASMSEGLRRGVVRAGHQSPSFSYVPWPDGVLYEVNHADPQSVIGFTMPLLADAQSLTKLTNPKQRRANFPALAPNGLLLAAYNIASSVAHLHGPGGCNGLVIGDLTPRNVMLTANLHCRLIDADSYQVSTSKVVHRALDSTPGFRSPQVAKAARAGVPAPLLTIADDAFCLAIVLFHVLVDGAHPFTAGERFEVNGIKPDEEDNLLEGRFPYADPAQMHPPKIRLQTYLRLPDPIRNAFAGAFQGASRFTAHMWADLLGNVLRSTVPKAA